LPFPSVLHFILSGGKLCRVGDRCRDGNAVLKAFKLGIEEVAQLVESYSNGLDDPEKREPHRSCRFGSRLTQAVEDRRPRPKSGTRLAL
jgi:hypothetical protein